MPHNIFISLTQQDTKIAEALRETFRSLFGDFINVNFSTSNELKGGIKSGEDWFQWIVNKVLECDFALILITPASLHKPWILWEAGAVAGAALASDQGGLRKIRPLVYQVGKDHIPSPIRESKVQFRRGDRTDEMKSLLMEIVDDYKNELQTDRVVEVGTKLEETVQTYLKKVETCLLNAPAIASSVVIEEWRLRLEDVMEQNRPSEVEHLHDWMNIAFGRERDEKPQPLDMRIHTRLASLYLKAKKYPKAIDQLELARQLAPRDIFVLRLLGKAYLESLDRDRAKVIMERIEELDRTAFVHNAECAALAGRWYRNGGNLAKAEEVYATALDHNFDSYYLANVLAEVRLERGNKTAATEAFQRALAIIEELTDSNIWTHATAANAAFFIGNDQQASKHLADIKSLRPDADSLSSIENGLKGIAKQIENGHTRLQTLLGALRR